MQTGDSYNRGGFIALIGSIVFSLGFFTYVTFGYKGIDLKEIPEEKAVTADGPALAEAPGLPANFDINKVAKPWVSSPEVITYGRQVFLNNCAVCHGQEGKGDGPAGAALNPKPRNFVEGKWKKGGDSASIFATLQTGIEGSSMASFKHLPKNDRWSVIQYIRSITQNKTPDDPAKLDKYAQTAQ